MTENGDAEILGGDTATHRTTWKNRFLPEPLRPDATPVWQQRSWRPYAPS
ncbi:hypothetical protein [Streptomyces tauricus]|nr:hypothetical protein [Streptomyces tauricus]MCW8101742.1 hypothetical protein [Streptomyces tauricus]